MQQQCREATPRTASQPDAARLQYLVEELRTPVVVINAYVQIIRRRIQREPVLDPRDLLDHLAVIERSTHRLDSRLRAAERDASRTRAQSD